MIKDIDVERALGLIVRAKVADDLRAVLSRDGRGAPSALSVEACLAGCLLTVQRGKAMTYENVHRSLTQDISLTAQRKLGVRYRHGGDGSERTITRRPIENMLNRLGLRLGYRRTSHPDLDRAERARRSKLLQSVVDRLLDASKPFDLPATGCYALDATGIWTWGRARPAGVESSDRDAHWGHKTATSGEKEMFFGYDLYVAVRIREMGDNRPYPHLIERLTVRPAASDEAKSTLPMVREMTTGAYPVKVLITDRAWSYKKPHRWVDRLRELGIEQVVDLHDKDYGARDYQGLRIVAGWPHCPAMPDDLVDIRRPKHLRLPDGLTVDDFPDLDGTEGDVELETRAFSDRITRRRAYATRRTAGPNDRGDERHECPAEAGQVRCPLKALSMHLPADRPRITNPPAEAGRPSICTQRTVKVPGTVTPKVRQRQYWGSVEWIRSFARRTHVEGAFGNLKNRNTENLSRGWIQVTGHARNTLMLAIVAAAYNLRVGRKWNAQVNLSYDPLFQADPPFLGWREVTDVDDQAA